MAWTVDTAGVASETIVTAFVIVMDGMEVLAVGEEFRVLVIVIAVCRLGGHHRRAEAHLVIVKTVVLPETTAGLVELAVT